MKLLNSADEIREYLGEESVSLEEAAKNPYMLVFWNICYQLARIADRISQP